MASFLQNIHPIDSHYLDYATQYAQLSALADLRRQRQQETAARAQETEMNALKLEQARQAMSEQAIIREKFPGLMADPQYQTEGKPDFEKILPALAQQRGIGLGTIQGLQKTILDNVKQRAEVQKLIAEAAKAKQEAEIQQQTAMGSGRDHYAGVIQDYLDLPDDGRKPGTLEGIFQRELNDPAGTLYRKQMQADYERFHALPQDQQQVFLQQVAGSMSPAAQEARAKAAKEKLGLTTARRTEALQAISPLALDANQVPADMDAYRAIAAKYPDILPPNPGPGDLPRLVKSAVAIKDQPGYQKDLTEAQAMQAYAQNPAQAFTELDQALPPKRFAGANQASRAEITAALSRGDFGAIKTALASARAYRDRIEGETDPGVQAVMLQRHAAAAAASAAASQAPYRGTALEHVPPHLQGQASTENMKAGKAYVDAVGAAQEMQDIIDLARGGNKVAYSYAPTTGVLTINTGTGIKRVNTAEIESYAGAGSDMDRLKGWLGKHLSGESISGDVLNSMESLHARLGESSRQKYENSLSVINQNYGSSFKPVTLPNMPQSGGLPNGNGKALDKATAQKFLQAAGGNAIQARELARKHNWVIQ